MVKIENIMEIIILYCQSKGYSINPLKLQKLLYFVQAWHIVKFDKNSLFQELPEAWVNGPVYRSIYNTLKAKFYKNVNFINRLYNDENKLHKRLSELVLHSNLSIDQQDLLFTVLNIYGTMSDKKLVFATHAAEPWNNARKGCKSFERCTTMITIDDMYNYYSRK
jgi:uncharacterized phage-associated protein